jgi:hypothetical protein
MTIDTTSIVAMTIRNVYCSDDVCRQFTVSADELRRSSGKSCSDLSETEFFLAACDYIEAYGDYAVSTEDAKIYDVIFA